MYTHLTQFTTCCWKYWDISAPFTLFERKEADRTNANFIGWWGPAKGVPLLVFVVTDVPFSEVTTSAVKKAQEYLQTRLKGIFRALHLTPASQDYGGSSSASVDVKSLFLLPSTTQPILHIIPLDTTEICKENIYHHHDPPSLTDLLNQIKVDSVSSTLPQEYRGGLLKSFVNGWSKNATTRHPLHKKINDAKSIPLPLPIHFATAAVPLLHFLFNQRMEENGSNFREILASQYPSTKGMIQQIEVILRKKIKENIEIERVFSKNHCHNVMQSCNEFYLQDSPTYYPEKYHRWKRDSALQQYNALARGVCKDDYADILERECDSVWKKDRQSCECHSLTDRCCRLKIGHESSYSQKKDDRSNLVDSAKHSSGLTLFHACTCGRTQKLRDDPFDILEANFTFYDQFTCCRGKDMSFLDIKQSKLGIYQRLVLKCDGPSSTDDAALLLLGPHFFYKNSHGLDKTEGFLNNTNYLIPWSITTVNEIKLHQQEQLTKDARNRAYISHQEEWPVLGDEKPATVAASVSLVGFPALGSTPAAASTPAVITRQLFQHKEVNVKKHQRHNKARDRVRGLVRGYVGAEYECAQGHRFLSCGDGRVCKLGHASHPKEHGNHFIHQDLSIFMTCPFCYSNPTTHTTPVHTHPNEITAQLMRLYFVTPDEDVTVTLEPRIKIHATGMSEPMVDDLGFAEPLSLGRGSAYVLRLPFIYRDREGATLPLASDIERRSQSVVLLKDYLKFHYRRTRKWMDWS
ncbi:hypothetical protein BY458DRAFT_518492 [Sporodiniella umbellata]|nr:hypothetical protein BY458DRAFT_518492 [Sporodiniella umbellata]